MISASVLKHVISAVFSNPQVKSRELGPDFLTWPIIAMIFAMSASANGQDLPPTLVQTNQIKYLTGKKLDRRNEKPLSVWWRDAELRDRLMAFSANESISVMIDRRVDPQTLVNLGVDSRSVEQFLWQAATAARLSVCRVEDCYYFGPSEIVSVLPILEQDLETLAKKKVSKRSIVTWSAKRPLQTGTIVQPKSILESLGRDNRFAIEGIDQIPYDLWHGFSLPPTTLYTRVQLVLAGFDKTFKISNDGRTITIIDLPTIDSATRRFAVSKRISDDDVVEKAFPTLEIKFGGKSVVGKGSPLQLAKLKAALVRRVQVAALDQDEVYTLKNEASRLTILKTIAADGRLELVLENIEEADLAKLIQIDVVKVSRDELIFKTLEGTGLNGVVQESQLIISRSN